MTVTNLNDIFELNSASQQQVLTFMLDNWQSILVKLPIYVEDLHLILTKNKLRIELKSLEDLLLELMELMPHYVSVKNLKSKVPGHSQTVLEYFNLKPLESIQPKSNNSCINSIENISRDSGLGQLVSEAMDCSSVAKDREQELNQLLSVPTSLEILAREYAVSQEAVRYIDACPLPARECAKSRTKPCNKIHFQSIIRNNTDVSLGDCSYLNTCFKGKNCRYVHYHISFPETCNKEESLVSTSSKIRPIVIPGESVGRSKVRAFKVFKIMETDREICDRSYQHSGLTMILKN